MVERTKMGNRNRTDYTKRFHNPVKPERVDEVPVEEVTEEVETVEEPVVETVEEAVEETQPEVITKLGIVNIEKNQSLNLREDMDTDSTIVKTLNTQESVIIDNEFHDWYHVTTESGAEGYVMSKFIKVV